MNGTAPPMWRLPNTVREIEPPRADLSAKRIFAAGRYTPQKGYDYLIHAFAPVARAHPDWELKICGHGHTKKRLQARIDEEGIGEQATLAGPTDDVPGEMAQASIYALSSRFEGFPLVLVEAMSKGMACVAFDCPTGPADIIDDHRNGLLVPAKDVEGLTAALMEMIEDEELRRRCGDAALETARDYTMAAIGPKWDEMLQALLRERAQRAGSATISRGACSDPSMRRLKLLLLTLLLAATAAPATADAAGRGQCLLRKSGPQCYALDRQGHVHRRRRHGLRRHRRRRLPQPLPRAHHGHERDGADHLHEPRLGAPRRVPRRRGDRAARAAAEGGQVKVRLMAQDPASRSQRRLRRSVAVRVNGRWIDVARTLISEGHAIWLPNHRE